VSAPVVWAVIPIGRWSIEVSAAELHAFVDGLVRATAAVFIPRVLELSTHSKITDVELRSFLRASPYVVSVVPGFRDFHVARGTETPPAA
jgi:hypothetical protein